MVVNGVERRSWQLIQKQMFIIDYIEPIEPATIMFYSIVAASYHLIKEAVATCFVVVFV